MSAYQVDYETIGRVLKAISKAGCYGPRYKQIEKLKQQYEKNAGIVFDQLLELNRLSLKGRYEDCESMFFDVDRSKTVWLSRQIGHNDYQLLKSLPESPQMPTGYPGMMLLSLFPPLWFGLMHKKIKKLNS